MNLRYIQIINYGIFLIATVAMVACNNGRKTFRPGEIWPDNNGVHINAHGGGILVHNDTYYLFGEHKEDAFIIWAMAG